MISPCGEIMTIDCDPPVRGSFTSSANTFESSAIRGDDDVTVKLAKRLAVPVSVFTENCRAPVAAPAAIVIVTGRLVDVPPVPIVAVTPLPENTMEVAPVRFVPVIVAAMFVP